MSGFEGGCNDAVDKPASVAFEEEICVVFAEVVVMSAADMRVLISQMPDEVKRKDKCNSRLVREMRQ